MIVFMRVCVFVFGLMRTQLLLLLYDVFIACAYTRTNTQLNRPCSLTMKRWMYQCNGIACWNGHIANKLRYHFPSYFGLVITYYYMYVCHTVACLLACLPAEASFVVKAFPAARICTMYSIVRSLIRLFSISMDAETVIDAPLLDIYVLFFYIISSGAIVWEWFWRFLDSTSLYTYFYLSLAVQLHFATENGCVYFISYCKRRHRIHSIRRSFDRSLCRATKSHVRWHRKMGCSNKQCEYTVGCALSAHFHRTFWIRRIHDSGWIE